MVRENTRLSTAAYSRRLLWAAVLLAAPQMVHAQSILGGNLIVNGNAEAGPAGTATTLAASIPGWTRASGKINVLPYDVTGLVLLNDPAPPDHGFQYFAGVYGDYPPPGTLTQDIDVSSGASLINGGNVKFTASAYLGTMAPDAGANHAQMVVAFKNANGQAFSSTTLGPLTNVAGTAMFLQQQIGLVPVGTVRITVTLSLSSFNAGAGNVGVADSLSLVLTTLGTSPGSVLGVNLVVNPGAEAGPGVPQPTTVLYIPGWSTQTQPASVAPYGGTGWIPASAPGPADRGVNLFCGWQYADSSGDNSGMYQDIDVSPAAALIDSGQVTYQASAWLGGVSGNTSPTLTYTFFDWSGKQLAVTGQLGPASHSGTALVETSHSDTLPSGTRRVHIALTFPDPGSIADDIAFTLAAPSGPPVITPGGIVSAGAFGGFSSIAPGSWIEIYGTFLSSSIRSWSGSDFNNGVAPTSLDGVSVSIGGKAAFIDYISGGQIDALVPSDAPTGPVGITVTNSNGTSDNFWLTVNPTEPGLLAPAAFKVNGKQYVAALFSDGQTFAIPNGAISGVASRPAKPGETLIIYGVGFGPVTGDSTAGTIVTDQNSLTTPVQILFGTTPTATPSYYGLAPSFTGLYQFNVVVPTVSTNAALPISIKLGGATGSQTLYIAVQQ
jgi:uncharacterized protein (TIGR03437 family)